MEIYNNVKLDASLPKGAVNFIKAASHRHFSYDSIKIIEARHSYVKMSADVLPETSNPYGMMHGGILFMLADTVAGLTSISMGKKVVTLGSNISFVKPAKSGRVYASPEVIHKGRTTILLEVSIVDESSNLICKATFNMFVIGDVKEFEVENE